MSNVTNFPCPVANDANIRVVMINDEPWFVARDVLNVLDVPAGTTNMYLKKLDELDKQQLNFSLGSGRRPMVISESGLYKLIMRSDKPQAKPFQDWVTRDVLPAIRRTGWVKRRLRCPRTS